jgi:hypothetical protein
MRQKQLKPNQALTVFVVFVLIAHAAERERSGYRLECGLADGDLDHGVNSPT